MPSFGPTGKFPQGKVHASDEGELVFGVAIDHEHGVIVVKFGSPVAWLALPPDVAVQMAELILEKALILKASGPLPPIPS